MHHVKVINVGIAVFMRDRKMSSSKSQGLKQKDLFLDYFWLVDYTKGKKFIVHRYLISNYLHYINVRW